MMTGERVGVGHDGSRGAAYVQDWLKALEQDPKEMYKAAADAQKISDYLMRPIREREQTTDKEHGELAEKYSAARSPADQPDAPTAAAAAEPRAGGRHQPLGAPHVGPFRSSLARRRPDAGHHADAGRPREGCPGAPGHSTIRRARSHPHHGRRTGAGW